LLVLQDDLDRVKLRERLCKTLYYGRMPSLERPSLALTGKKFCSTHPSWISATNPANLVEGPFLVCGWSQTRTFFGKVWLWGQDRSADLSI